MLTADKFKTPPAGTVMQTDAADAGEIVGVDTDGTLTQITARTALQRPGQYGAGHVGMALIVQADGSAQPGSVPFVPANLHDTWWVDANTTVPAADQTGNEQRPFATITQALAAAQAIGDGGPYVINIVPAQYTTEGAIPSPVDHGDVVLQNIAGPDAADKVTIQTLTLTGGMGWLTMIGIVTTQSLDARPSFGLLPQGCTFADCLFALRTTAQRCSFGALSAQDTANNVRLVECDLPLTGAQFTTSCNVTVEQTQLPGDFVFAFTSGGLLRVDNMTWGGMQRVGATATGAPVQLINNEAQVFSGADLPLGADPLQSFPAYTFGAYPVLDASSIYLIEYYVQVAIYKDAGHSVVGQIDFTVQASISTDAFGVATTTFNTVPVPNVSYLPAALAGASSNIVASANGWTVQAQRPAGMACHARYTVSWNKVENVT